MGYRDDREKGGERIRSTILFGKYQLIRILDQKENCTVHLAIHIGLDEHRIIKRVPKGNTENHLFYQEVSSLRQLRHPGIPIIYDLEEDSEYHYLIEEYLEGETLSYLVTSQGSLSPDVVLNYGIQICELVCYLHSSVGTNPILHLDIHPNNLLLCHNIIKLIDFNQSATIQKANQVKRRYGTAGCAAPEQYTTDLLDERTDIYAIGAVLFFMREGSYPHKLVYLKKHLWPDQLKTVVETCLQRDKEDRYCTVDQLLEKLNKVNLKQQPSSLSIAFVGSKTGVGTTHLAISFAVYLHHQKYSCLYEEKHESNAVESMASHAGVKRNSFGFYKINGIICKPAYGHAVKLGKHTFSIVLKDYGTEWELAKKNHVDYVVLLVGGQMWDIKNNEKAINFWKDQDNLFIIYRDGIINRQNIPQSLFIKNCMIIPHILDPFSIDKKSTLFFTLLWGALNNQMKERGFVRSLVKKVKLFINKKLLLLV